MSPRRIAISVGDPSGIGPEVLSKALPEFASHDIEFAIFCPRAFFEKLAEKFLWARDLTEFPRERVRFVDCFEPNWSEGFGEAEAINGRFAMNSLEHAVEAVLAGEADALVTAPLSKLIVEMAIGSGFRGHTEFLRERSGADEIAMMLIADNLRVVPLTRHVPIADVPSMIDEASIVKAIEIIARAMIKFEKIRRPRIGVLALNPHAGDGGLFGTEEAIIDSAIDSVPPDVCEAVGPLVPDVAFIPDVREKFDAILGMFHDQVLIPLKMLGFDRGVNATLGLPFVRTSPDHGTAFDIAGQDRANPSSMIEAIRLAIRWCDS